MPDAADTVTFQFTVERELWDEWKNTVDRDRPLDTHIVSLLEADAASTTEPDQRTVSLTASRIKHRSMEAIRECRGDPDVTALREELSEILNLAETLD